MSWSQFVCTLCAASLLVSSAWGQSRQQQVDELRTLVRTVQQRIAELEGGSDAPSKHVTELGGARPSRKLELPAEEVMILRMYDLSDLFAPAPQYLAQQTSDLSQTERPLFPVVQAPSVGAGYGYGAMGHGGGYGAGPYGGEGGGGYAEAATNNLSAAQTTVESLIDAIRTTIAPQAWDSVGGPASIAVLGNALLISANPDMHEQIDSLLNLFRQKWGSLRTVSVSAYWIWLTDGELAELLQQGAGKNSSPDAADKSEPAPREAAKSEPTALVAGGPAGHEEVSAVSRTAFGAVSDAAWERLLQQADAANDRPGGYRAVVTCYNGQTVHTISGGQTVLVTGMTPVVGGGSENGVGYTPNIAIVQQGAALQVTPITTSNGKYVVLDIHSRVNMLRNSKPDVAQPAPASTNTPAGVVAAIDRPRLMTHRLSTTLRVPVGQPTLIGGITFESEPKPGEPSLYLFVKIAVQELRDADPNAADGTAEGPKDNSSGDEQ
jgi:hypothetical protein